MKLFKLRVTGNDKIFSINYTAAANFIDYKDCGYAGTEQEKYDMFLADLEKNGGPQPVNIKVKMTIQTTDRALAKSDVLRIKDVNDFIKRLGR